MEGTFSVTLWQDEDGCFVAECPAVPGCVSQGPTRAAAIDNIRAAIRECLAVRKAQGLPLKVETEQVEITCA